MSQNLNFSGNSGFRFEVTSILSTDRLLVKMPSSHYVKAELRYTMQMLSAYRLHHSAKWAGELLLGVTKQTDFEENFLLRNFNSNNTDPTYQFDRIYMEKYDKSTDVLMLARNLFDLREYKKCAHLLKDYAKGGQFQQATFLYYYSLYLHGEMWSEEEMLEHEATGKACVNKEIHALEKEISELVGSGFIDEPTLFLYGLILKKLERKEEAKMVFVQVLNSLPCFWSAWLELCPLIESEDLPNALSKLKDHWMKNFFFSSFTLEKNMFNMCCEITYGLLCFFLNSTFLMNQIAYCFYNNQDYDISLDWFERLISQDPFRYENMDAYSNILYIKEAQGELANLALRSFYSAKYTAESCCIIGNYYSLLGDHMKAILYFRKALRLDRNFLAAWTLMGHEYLETKNIAGAIEAYRNAVEIDPKDYRAWYGLGQTFELQTLYHYALYYFSRAAAAKPKDARMWNALGNVYAKMEKNMEAAKCNERAVKFEDKELLASHQLGKLYNLMGNIEKAVDCFEKNLRQKEEEQIIDKEFGECLLYLAKFQKSLGNYEEALSYAKRLYDINASERDEANEIIYEVNSILSRQK